MKAPSGPRPGSAPPGPPRHPAAPAAAPVPAVSQSVDASQQGGGFPRGPGEQQQQQRRRQGALEPVSQSVDGSAWSRTPPEHMQRSIPEAEEEELQLQLQQQEEEAMRRGAMRGPQAPAEMYEPPPFAAAPAAPQRLMQQQQQTAAAEVWRRPPGEAAEAYPEAYSHQQVRKLEEQTWTAHRGDCCRLLMMPRGSKAGFSRKRVERREEKGGGKEKGGWAGGGCSGWRHHLPWPPPSRAPCLPPLDPPHTPAQRRRCSRSLSLQGIRSR